MLNSALQQPDFDSRKPISRLNGYRGPALGLALLAGALAMLLAAHPRRDPQVTQATTPQRYLDPKTPTVPASTILKTFDAMPLRFTPNKGQCDSRVYYAARGSGYGLFLTGTDAVLVLKGSERKKNLDGKSGETVRTDACAIRICWGDGPALRQPVGEEVLAGRSSFFKGRDAGDWKTGIESFRKIRYPDAYPGIDMVFYGRQSRLEYDFIVSPGHDVKQIALRIEDLANHSLHPRIDEAGRLIIETAFGEIIQQAPFSYQVDGGRRRSIASRYRVDAEGRVGFEVAGYDRDRPLIIDPVLDYSTYLGGTSDDIGVDLAVDRDGNAYIVGETFSADFPAVGPAQSANLGGFDAFVSKLDPTGTSLVYSTYIGGSLDDFGKAIAIDSDGYAYITGETRSTNFPVTSSAFQTQFGGFSSQGDAFVARLNPAGNTLIYSSYLGGGGGDVGYDIAADSAGNAYVVGGTGSSNFPLANAFQSVSGTLGDGFLSKVESTGRVLVYSTYLGGTANENALCVAVDSTNSPVVAGFTNSTDFPLQDPFQNETGGMRDVFVTKFANTGNTLTFSTFLGGKDDDTANNIALDAEANVYLVGETRSTNFPLKSNLQKSLGGIADGFVTKLKSTGATLLYSTFLGGKNFDAARGIAVDADNHAFVTGVTESNNFPVETPFQAKFGGGTTDAFVTKFSTSGSSVDYSTFLGGATLDGGFGIGLDAAGNTYVCGSTDSTDFPVTNAFQTTLRGTVDTFVAKLVEAPQPVAIVEADDTEGIAPLSVRFNASGSTAPSNGTLTTYLWDFGDGNTDTTTTATTTHTYATSGTFVAFLIVVDNQGQSSQKAYLPIVLGDNLVDDADLLVNKAQFSINWKQHLKEEPADTIKMSGFINPAGLAVQSGRTVAISINSVEVLPATSFTSRGRISPRVPENINASVVLGSNGAYSISIQNADLREALGARDASVQTTLRMQVLLSFTNASLTTETFAAVIEAPYQSTAGASARSTFAFNRDETFTGVFRLTKTSAAGGSQGGFKITASGQIDGDLGRSVIPNGDIVVSIGTGGSGNGAVLTIPKSSLSFKGIGANISVTYSKQLGEIPELKKFQINNASHNISLATNEILDTGIPASGANSFDLPIVMTVPTSDGPFIFTTTIELQRGSSSNSWRR